MSHAQINWQEAGECLHSAGHLTVYLHTANAVTSHELCSCDVSMAQEQRGQKANALQRTIEVRESVSLYSFILQRKDSYVR